MKKKTRLVTLVALSSLLGVILAGSGSDNYVLASSNSQQVVSQRKSNLQSFYSDSKITKASISPLNITQNTGGNLTTNYHGTFGPHLFPEEDMYFMVNLPVEFKDIVNKAYNTGDLLKYINTDGSKIYRILESKKITFDAAQAITYDSQNNTLIFKADQKLGYMTTGGQIDFNFNLDFKQLYNNVSTKANIPNAISGNGYLINIGENNTGEMPTADPNRVAQAYFDQKMAISDRGEKPTISAPDLTLIKNEPFDKVKQLENVSAQDPEDGDLTDHVQVTNPEVVDPTTEGTYLVKYSVMDSDFNQVSTIRNVIVKAPEAGKVTTDLFKMTQLGYTDTAIKGTCSLNVRKVSVKVDGKESTKLAVNGDGSFNYNTINLPSEIDKNSNVQVIGYDEFGNQIVDHQVKIYYGESVTVANDYYMGTDYITGSSLGDGKQVDVYIDGTLTWSNLAAINNKQLKMPVERNTIKSGDTVTLNILDQYGLILEKDVPVKIVAKI